MTFTLGLPMPPLPSLSAEEQLLQERTKGKRLFQLDALRGLAAACVVLHHFRFAFHMEPPRWMWIPFFAGRSAVVLFFVLSGYVLSLPYWSGRRRPYGTYLIRRFCRIYLPFFFAALLSIAGAFWFYGSRLPLTPWFYGTWQTRVTWPLVMKQLLMWPFGTFNTAFWSLRFEMQMSIVMPFLCALLRRFHALRVTIGVGILVYAKPSMLDVLQWHFFNQTIQIASLFLFGAMLARYRRELEPIFVRSGKYQWLVLGASLVLYNNYLVRATHGQLRYAIELREQLFIGIGAAGIILCSLHLKPFARVLEHALPEYLGRISYSLYLMHGIVIFALLDLLYGKVALVYGKVPLALLTGVVLTACLCAAHLFYKAVEEPSMKFGQRFGAGR